MSYSKQINIGRFKTEQQAKAALSGAETIANILGHAVTTHQIYTHDFENFDKVETFFMCDVILEKIRRQ